MRHFSFTQKVKTDVKHLKKNTIVEKVDFLTAWVNSILLIDKPNGKLIICLDSKSLNKYTKRMHYIIPICEDILGKLGDKSIFTVIDMKDGLWKIEIGKISSELSTFDTPFGRLQFGILCAPEIFQKKNVETFGDIPGVEIYFGDIIVSCENEAEHDYNLKNVLDRASKFNVKFNSSSLQYGIAQVTFVGPKRSNEIPWPS